MSVKRWMAVAGCIAAAGSVAACGSSDDTSSGAATTADAPPSSGGSELVSGAKTLLKDSTAGLTYSATDFPTSPDQIEPYGDWRGPTKAPAIKKGANVQVIVCTKQAAACVQAADGIKDAGKALGWKVDVIDGAGTPEGFAKAFDTAFSRNPDAIINVAVAALAVGDKLAEAKKRGIVTVVTGDIPPTGGEEPYQAYVSFRMPFMESLLAYAEIARTDGKANSIVVTDNGVPSLIEAMGQYKKVLKTCAECKVTDVSWKIADAADPTKVTSIIGGALAKNPTATSISVPYAIGLPAVIQAIESAGKADQVKVLIKDGDKVGLQALQEGQVEYNSCASPTWAGWAATDQAIRGLAKAPYLKGEEVGLGLVTFTKDNAPADGNIDTTDGMPDFAAEYKKAWGIG
jgi:ribose transport system substrate-binding protein